MLCDDNVKNPPRLSRASRPKRVLVLDDDSILREVAKPVLSDLGYEVLLMEDGLHDDKFFAKLKIDAAIVDLGLPGISGLEVIEKLRATDRGKDMPIFVVTASDDLNEIRKCYDERIVAFVLSKPIDWGFLTHQLQELLATPR